ncbi:MAG TPA: LysM peptidoglycan-binding domain-containing protein [Opitutaceae bacterium]|nr:LysM peptidoglycan-binding domain-containing protein [Opitutaceae bacterium]
MWKCLLIACAATATALAQNPASSLDVANLREDVRGLSQRVSELTLRLEQLERENGDLKLRASSAGQSYATVAQLNDAVAELNRTIKLAVSTAKNETLQQVAAQMEKLGQQTNAALESLARTQAAAPAPAPRAGAPAPTAFSENFPKEGANYTVQKGDSLAGIAKKTGAKPQDIINANKLADPDRLVPGQTLFIPGGK